jgi:catechol 2,3-dioxygenase-like lactoylglutathione lyase family enzyme
MTTYVPLTLQLVTEILVRDIRRSTNFYRSLGFQLLRDDGDFVELTWEDHRLFLADPHAFDVAEGVPAPVPPPFPLANVRVMIPDVDDCWDRANQLGAKWLCPSATATTASATSPSPTPTASASASPAC